MNANVSVTMVMVIMLVCLLVPAQARATWSIAACTPDGTCGVAVATNNLAVGASVIHARAGVGALVTQYETNPAYGPIGLDLLADGLPPSAVIARLLAGDGNFDGTTIAARQVGVVAASGASAVYTGEEAAASQWAGARRGHGYATQGNGLVSEQVLVAMETAFLACRDALARCLMTGVEAGEQAGGQATGRLSAALLVRTPGGGWNDIDLRVDASASPLADLRGLLDRHDAHRAMIRAERLAASGKPAQAREALAEALHLGHRWDRIWRRAARLAMHMGEFDDALAHLGVFAAENPEWARIELQDPLYRPLRGRALFSARAGEPVDGP